MRLAYFSLLLFICACLPSNNIERTKAKVIYEGTAFKGLNFSAPPSPFSKNPTIDIQAIGANWLAVIPYGFSRVNKAKVHYNTNGQQWWGERPEGVRKTIELAKAANIKVMLKPQIYIPGGWTGGMDFETEAEWNSWEAGYRDYILFFAKIATEMEVELFCIGTEFKMSIQKRDAFWRDLIKEIKSVYDGPLTYAANWDEYPLVKFWDELDYIGIDAYFPLSEESTPSVENLKSAWKPIVNEIQKVSDQYALPVLFTEYGYLSVDGCAGKTWELESNIGNCKINENAQVNALTALYEVFEKESFWAGGFLWKWYPSDGGHKEFPGKDYCPQGKLAYNTVKEFYGKR